MRYVVLVEFAHRHADFQLAELDSVLDMHGIRRGTTDCEQMALPGSSIYHRPFCLLSFSKEHKTIGSIILDRCTLVRSVIEIWGLAKSLDECVAHVRNWIDHSQGIYERCLSPDKSWKLTVQAIGSKLSFEEQTQLRSNFSFLGFRGPVKMEHPTEEYLLLCEVELDDQANPVYPRFDCHQNPIPENQNRPPLAVYFGRALGGNRRAKGRGNVDAFSLKKRAYLGPTSMDAELSLIMTNLGQVRPHSVVLDPFVGTGSILLTCALRGAMCVGTDIDIRVLRGRSENENIWSNFAQFNLPQPEIVRSDNALYSRHFRTQVPLYDAIVCDPPYGIRAGARMSGSRRNQPRPVSEEHRHDHIAQTKVYPVSDVMADLLDMAAQTLELGCRLVYIIPSFRDFNEEEDLPRHACLELVHSCYQPLSIDLGRRLVAMKKIAEYDESKREEYMAHVWKNGPASAEKCANIREKLIEAAKAKPDYEVKAALRKQKRKDKREAKKKAKREASVD